MCLKYKNIKNEKMNAPPTHSVFVSVVWISVCQHHRQMVAASPERIKKTNKHLIKQNDTKSCDAHSETDAFENKFYLQICL